jgi:hypothetical protein
VVRGQHDFAVGLGREHRVLETASPWIDFPRSTGHAALHHGPTVVSRDVSDYAKANAPRVNPWFDEKSAEISGRAPKATPLMRVHLRAIGAMIALRAIAALPLAVCSSAPPRGGPCMRGNITVSANAPSTAPQHEAGGLVASTAFRMGSGATALTTLLR